MMTDDGVGHEVLARLERCELPNGVRLFAVDGDVLALVDVWKGEPEVWLVDAVDSQEPAGTLHIYRHQKLFRLPPGGLSTHHPNLAVSLRWILHARPEMATVEFTLYGVRVGVVRPGRGLTPAVQNSADRLIADISRAARELAENTRGAPHRSEGPISS
jgi:hydrogenase maturation protease